MKHPLPRQTLRSSGRARTATVTLTLLAAACSDPADPLDVKASPASVASARAVDPTGERIAFVSSNADGSSSIVSMNTDGTDLQTLTKRHRDGAPSWSPDFTQIVFTRDGSQIVVMSASGRRPRVIGTGLHPVYSPNGEKIAFTRLVANDAHIFVMNADGSNVRQLTSAARNDNQPTWAPDGQRIAFAGASNGAKQEIYLMNADGSSVQQLTNCAAEGANCGDPDWSPIPGDDRIAYTIFNPVGQLRLIGAQGDDTFVTLVDDNVFHASWSRDGKAIAFTDTALGAPGTDIFSIDVATTQLRRLTTDSKANREPAWSR